MSQPRLLVLSLLALVPVMACTNPEGSAPTVTPAPVVRVDPTVRPDGWAGYQAPTSPGGAAAPTTRFYTVTNRAQFLNALKTDGTSFSDLPKVISIEGMIDLCSDAAGKHLEAEDFLAQAGYSAVYPTYAAYRDAYAASCAVATTAVPNPVPGLKAVQAAAAAKQKAVVVVPVGSNTTIFGVGDGAGLVNGTLSISGKSNIVVRNLSIFDSYDYFPVWDPTDSNGGMVNSNYDTVAISGSTSVWIDHCRVGDGARPDSGLPHVTISGVDKKWVTHDGLIDVTNGSNFVTLSWNRVENHDKTMLFGGSDSATGDVGKLKVTVHHNWFVGTIQRLPRVRFGQVHVYNNYYEQVASYAIGVGDQARIVSEANDFSGTTKAFSLSDHASAEGYVSDVGSLKSPNDASTEPLATAAQVGWKPSDVYAYVPDLAAEVKAKVTAGAGVGRL